MALIKCPECGKEVSDSVIKCPNCGYVVNKPKRSLFGKIFHFSFILVNVIFFIALILWIIGSISAGSNAPDADTAAVATAAGTLGVGGIIFTWVMFAVPFGILSYITRPKAD